MHEDGFGVWVLNLVAILTLFLGVYLFIFSGI